MKDKYTNSLLMVLLLCFAAIYFSSQKLQLKYQLILYDYLIIVKNLKQALGSKRFVSIFKELKFQFYNDPNIIEVASISIWPANRERYNPEARRVEIRFTNS